MKTNTYPHLADTIKTNPAVAAAHRYEQDDGFGNLIDTFNLCLKDDNRTCYLYAFLEHEDNMSYNHIFYGEH